MVIGRYWQAHAGSTQGGLCLERCTRRRRVVARPKSGMLIAGQCDLRYANHHALILDHDVSRSGAIIEDGRGEEKALDSHSQEKVLGIYLVGQITCRMV